MLSLCSLESTLWDVLHPVLDWKTKVKSMECIQVKRCPWACPDDWGISPNPHSSPMWSHLPPVPPPIWRLFWPPLQPFKTSHCAFSVISTLCIHELHKPPLSSKRMLPSHFPTFPHVLGRTGDSQEWRKGTQTQLFLNPTLFCFLPPPSLFRIPHVTYQKVISHSSKDVTY